MAGPLLRRGQDSGGCTTSLCQALKTNPGHAGAADSGWSSMCSSHAGIGGAKRGPVPSAAQDGGIGDRDMVVNNHARAPSPAAAPHWRPPSTRSPARSPNSRPQPPGARPDASTAHRRHFHHPAAPAQRRQGTSPVRPGPMTGVVSAGPARCCEQGPMNKLIVVLAACARQVGEPTGAKPRGSAWRERTPGHMCSCARS
jgi:hypothetical protein